jgi:hypothetical protein
VPPPLPRPTLLLLKLRDYLIEAGYVTTISVETVRRVLGERGVSWQATKTWKTSTDPEFTSKMRRILDLYDHHPPTAGCSASTSSGR